MRLCHAILAFFLFTSVLCLGEELRHVGDYLLKSHFKIAGSKKISIPIKPIAFRVYTDGVLVKVTTEDNEQAHTTFEIYRSDGISRQRIGGGALEILPGVQAMSKTDGILKHLRLSSESMTITAFPGVSDQTIVSHSVAAEPIQKMKPIPPRIFDPKDEANP